MFWRFALTCLCAVCTHFNKLQSPKDLKAVALCCLTSACTGVEKIALDSYIELKNQFVQEDRNVLLLSVAHWLNITQLRNFRFALTRNPLLI